MDKLSIKIKSRVDGKTLFTDEKKTYIVSGKFDQFVRLKILNRFNPESTWKWKSLGQPQNTYLAGPQINLKLADKRLTNISQLKELSDDSEYQKLLDYCSNSFTNKKSPEKKKKASENTIISTFIDASKAQNLIFPPYLTKRYVASLATKPFVIFTGLSGSGKTKLAQTFAKWLCKSKEQYKIISVGADWTNREPLLGYPNSLDPKNYVLPDNGALALVIEAAENAKDKQIEECDPYFLILDEMNLSHVERYFADFLSAMESKEEIMLYSGETRTASNGLIIPDKIKLPPNLFIVGTVNIDETTYMFSPKVLDRANTIEFRLDEEDISSFFTTQIVSDPEPIEGQGSDYAQTLMQLAAKDFSGSSKDASSLLAFFGELQKLGAEFGYRTASEMMRLMHQLKSLGMDTSKKESALDVAVMQKMLPKLHGSRSKLTKVLPVLASFCLDENNTEMAKQFLDTYKNDRQLKKVQNEEVVLPLSFTKIARMYTNAIENGFANYAEG
jgi:5-methylcytosine-specific restriction protein B